MGFLGLGGGSTSGIRKYSLPLIPEVLRKYCLPLIPGVDVVDALEVEVAVPVTHSCRAKREQLDTLTPTPKRQMPHHVLLAGPRVGAAPPGRCLRGPRRDSPLPREYFRDWGGEYFLDIGRGGVDVVDALEVEGAVLVREERMFIEPTLEATHGAK